MKWYRGPDGSDRIWFDAGEIENLAEAELRKAGLLPTLAAPVVDIERLIESHLRARLDQYAYLGADVLGVTEFPPELPPEIHINKELTQAALDTAQAPSGLRGRWRATLAHEASHVMLHQVLFDLDPNQGRPAGDEGLRRMRCLNREVTFRRHAKDWRELQANIGMAALLMPRAGFCQAAEQEFQRLGVQVGSVEEGSKESGEIAAGLASTFEVSRQAAGIRLATLRLVSPLPRSMLRPP